MTGTAASATRTRLAAILADSLHETERLRTALEAERAALEANDAEALVHATQAKTGPIAKLAALDSDRTTASREAGFEPGAKGMDAMIDWCDEGSVLADGWHRLLDAARECDRHNATNGAIIRLRRQQVMSGLAILRGDEFSGETYAASGIEQGPAAGRALAQA